MNPNTGQFEKLSEAITEAYGKEAEAQLGHHDRKRERRLAKSIANLVRPDGSPMPKHWTVYTVGELVAVKDWTFRVAHVGEGHLLLEPVTPEEHKLEGEKG